MVRSSRRQRTTTAAAAAAQDIEIQGPRSALSAFLAAHNISAREIRESHLRRQANRNNDDQVAAARNQSINISTTVSASQVTTSATGDDTITQVAAATASKRKSTTKGKKKKGKIDSHSEDEKNEDTGSDYEDTSSKLWTKSVDSGLVGQTSNCAFCDKRFTVTPYTRTNDSGAFLCTPCGKQQSGDKLSQKRKALNASARSTTRKRRAMQSEILDGKGNRLGAKSLVQLCLETISEHKEDIETFGDISSNLIHDISKIFSKSRQLTSDSVSLFLRPDQSEIKIYDCAKLCTEDYIRAIEQMPELTSLVLHNAYQFKDVSVDALIQHSNNLADVRLYAANLVSSEKWSQFFKARGAQLKVLKLRWLDAAFEDQQVEDLVAFCPNLESLKLENVFRLTSASLKHLESLQHLRHLALQISTDVTAKCLVSLIKAVGANLQTLSLRGFAELDDTVLQTIHDVTLDLKKLRLTDANNVSEQGFVSLFTDWKNDPLRFVDLSRTREMDGDEIIAPDDDGQDSDSDDKSTSESPEMDAMGFASKGFEALMLHSGNNLVHLDLTACRHISLASLLKTFAPSTDDEAAAITYPNLSTINLNFVGQFNEVALAGLFRTAKQSLHRVELFGCFNVQAGVIVPRGVVVIGAPRLELDEGGMEVYGASAIGSNVLEGDNAYEMDTVTGNWEDALGLNTTLPAILAS